MRTLLMLRGAPGCGKSTFVREHQLEPYTISSDTVRLLYRAPVLDLNGRRSISQASGSIVWHTLYEMIEHRLAKGDFMVVDATFSRTTEMRRLKRLADQYRYRSYLVDFTDVPLDECLRRNSQRDDYRIVPEEVIRGMYQRFAEEPVLQGIKVLNPSEFESVFVQKVDLSHYRKIVHIGDIHGCYSALREYLREPDKNCCYIFTGDFLDRGIENVKVLRYLLEICRSPNVILVEGNHEKHLYDYCHGQKSRSRVFETITRPELNAAGFDKWEIKKFCRRLTECLWYQYQGREVFVCHGGISALPYNPVFISSEQIIKGIGTYEDYLRTAYSWDRNTSDNCYQIFGHRNTEKSPMHVSKRCFCLEGEVENGGCLRIAELDSSGFHEVEIQNCVFKKLYS